jgi:hypothetical protein
MTLEIKLKDKIAYFSFLIPWPNNHFLEFLTKFFFIEHSKEDHDLAWFFHTFIYTERDFTFSPFHIFQSFNLLSL